MLKFFATCPKGLESLLLNELKDLHCAAVKETVAGVAFSGDLVTAMQVCLYSRLASRVLLELVTFNCEDDSDLYLGAQGVGYEQYFSSDKTIAVTFNGTNRSIRNTQYGALRVKDAICDRFVACGLPRPNVQKHQPDVHVVATLKKGEVTISLDLSGQAQFWRHYQRTTGAAPLKENLAAAIVLRSGFDGSQNFIDPMCGSGTLLLEAAAIATDLAPGLKRSNFGFFNLSFFTQPTKGLRAPAAPENATPENSATDDTELSGSQVWQQLIAQAQAKAAAGLERVKQAGVRFYGFDADSQVIAWAQENCEHAGLSEVITLQTCPLEQFTNPCAQDAPCVVVTNPPYGERMGNFNELIALYTTLGQKLRTLFSVGKAAVISSSPELLSCLRLAQDKSYRLFNGALECQLRVFSLHAQLGAGAATSADSAAASGVAAEASATVSPAVVAGAEVAPDFANRLSKNLKHLSKWADREQISAYRVYDADLPEYNAAIDRYNQCYVIQEYQAPSFIKAHVAQRRLLDMIAATLSVTGAQGDQVIVKSREKQKGESQYEKRDDALEYFMEVYEGPVRFRVNLHDYLDTGLFLDARPIRRLLSKLSQGKSFLNLFAYTCTASVMAALGGAKSTCSVDMSRTYLDWGRENFKLNQIDLLATASGTTSASGTGSASASASGTGASEQLKHRFIQADCLAYLSTDHNERYDLIYIDPPTFSNSKRMERSFDVQRDHLQLLANLTRHLNDEGVVIFCTNKRNFALDQGLADYGFSVENITSSTFDPDFKRDQHLHSCFKLIYKRAQQTKQPEALVSNTVQPRWAGQLEQKGERYSFETTGSDERGSRFARSERGERTGERFARSERSGEPRRPRGPQREGRDPQREGRGQGFGFGGQKQGFGRGSGRGPSRGAGGAQGERGRGRQATPERKVKVWGPQGVKEL